MQSKLHVSPKIKAHIGSLGMKRENSLRCSEQIKGNIVQCICVTQKKAHIGSLGMKRENSLRCSEQIKGLILYSETILITTNYVTTSKLGLVPYDEHPKSSKALSKKPRKLPLMETDQDLCIPQHP
jgi:hypothetical protein